MGWIKTFKNKDGSYDSFDWSLKTAFNVEAASIITLLFGVSFFCTIGPAACLFMYPWPGSRESDKHLFIAGIICSLIWCLDYSLGIFNWFIWGGWPETYLAITTINFTILILCVILLIFEKSVHNVLQTCEIPFLYFYGLNIFVIWKVFSFMRDILPNIMTLAETSIWVHIT